MQVELCAIDPQGKEVSGRRTRAVYQTTKQPEATMRRHRSIVVLQRHVLCPVRRQENVCTVVRLPDLQLITVAYLRDST
jgi:hypothetical protein